MKSAQTKRRRGGATPYRHEGGWRAPYVDLATGRRRFKKFATYDEALGFMERARAARRAQKDGILAAPPPPMPFRELYEQWRTARGQHKRSAVTDTILFEKHLRPFFGEMVVTQIQTAMVERFMGQLRRRRPIVRPDGSVDDRLSPSSIRAVLALLHTVLRYGQRTGAVQTLPQLDRPRVTVKEYPCFTTDAEVATFVRAARDAGPDVLAIYAGAIYTGARLSELRALRWGDVDFDRGLIRIGRSGDGPTKSGKVRFVPLADALAPILKEQKLRVGDGFALCFPGPDGQMLPRISAIFYRRFKAILRAAKLPDLRFHDLRHSFASLLVAKGVNLYTVGKLLGHSSPLMTARYSHLAPDSFAALRGIFGQSPPADAPADVVQLNPIEKGNEK
jgi:integrase